MITQHRSINGSLCPNEPMAKREHYFEHYKASVIDRPVCLQLVGSSHDMPMLEMHDERAERLRTHHASARTRVHRRTEGQDKIDLSS